MVSRVFQRSQWEFQRSCKCVLIVFQGSFKGVPSKFRRVFQGKLKGVSRDFQWVSRVFERNSKRISGKFQMCF